jgi:hypothetical protein
MSIVHLEWQVQSLLLGSVALCARPGYQARFVAGLKCMLDGAEGEGVYQGALTSDVVQVEADEYALGVSMSGRMEGADESSGREREAMTFHWRK